MNWINLLSLWDTLLSYLIQITLIHLLIKPNFIAQITLSFLPLARDLVVMDTGIV